MSVQTYTTIEAIAEVNRQSARAKNGIRIIELSTLSDVIPRAEAEAIRKELLARKVHVKQLTNQAEFGPWTKVPQFIQECMEVRCVPVGIMPITAEVLLFDDVVAIYQVEPDISVTIITDSAFAQIQGALFDAMWGTAEPLALLADGSTG
jgi:hypothetical protein